MKLSLVFIGTTGAGPVYSLEMAKALANSKQCRLQVIISENVTNINRWKVFFSNRCDVDFNIIQTYKHTPLAALKTLYFDTQKKQHLVDLILGFNADVLYVPFDLMWSNYVYRRVYKHMRIIETIHDPHPHDSVFGNFKWFVYRSLINRGQGKYVNDIVILNRKDVDYVKNTTGKNVFVIPHASFSYYVQEETNSNAIKNCIGFFGRIEQYKGLDLLVDAFEKQRNTDLKLLIAGSGAIDESLRKKIEHNESIELINRYIEDNEFQSLIEKVDFIVLPYKRASQSGVIPMAFAFGKTVIATRVGALEEQVPGGTGILVEPDSEEICRAIDDLYADPTRIRTYGDTAKCYAQTELTWEHSANLLIDLIHKTKIH